MVVIHTNQKFLSQNRFLRCLSIEIANFANQLQITNQEKFYDFEK